MIGTTLGPYTIDRELGSGGMGKVYAARTARKAAGLEPGIPVALKVVHAHLLETEGFFKRFLREAELGKRIIHENVVRTLDCDQLVVGGTNRIFLTMEYVEGQTLRGLLHELGRVPEELCRHIGREIAKGLAAIHAAGVVHRDMKPENVLITGDHVVKVMDLGVARLEGDAMRLSQTGAFVGSIHYAAPEAFREGGKHMDGRADLFALGLVLYELSSGVNPYLGDDVPRILNRLLHEEPRRLGDINPQLSPFFEEVVHRLLAKEPEERFASADRLLDVLEAGEDSAWWQAKARALQATTQRPIRRIRIPRETAVHGREEEIATLRGLYENAKAADGQVVLLEGEAGIGKSRLVDELIARLEQDGEDLNFLFGSYPPHGAATASGAFSTAYHGQFGEPGAAPWLGQTPALVPAFDALLRGDTTPTGCPPLTSASLQTCFVHATRNLSAERTTIVLIDDLHFAPEEGRALFTALAMSVPGHRILLIGTTQPGVDRTWLVHLNRLGAARLALRRLGPKDLVALLGDSLQSEHLAEEIAGKVAAKSDGNPFFVFEILRGLREGQLITRGADGTWVTTGAIGEIEMGESVLDLVNARVAGLTEEERELLDVAACSGHEFDPLLVGEVLGLAAIPVLKRLGRIERQHRLVRSAGLQYIFDHYQVQEALYGALSEPLRREYHAALADTLEARTKAADQEPSALDGAFCADLCEHLLKGARGARALRYLPTAQAHLEKGYANATAVALAERALSAPGLLAGAGRAEALLRLCGILDRLGDRARQEEAAREAVRLADVAEDDDLRGRAAGALGIVLLRTFRLEEADGPLRRALDISRARSDRTAEARAAGHLGALAYYQGRLAEAREHYFHARELSRANGDLETEAAAEGNLGIAVVAQGLLVEARGHFERYLALSRETGDLEGEASATENLGAVAQLQGRLEDARECFETSLALSRRAGDREGEATAIGNLANVLRALDRLAEALDYSQRALALGREIGGRQVEMGVLVNVGPIWLALGDRGHARDALTQALAQARELGVRHYEGHALENLAALADEEGDGAEADRLLEASLVLRREIEHADGVADSLIEIADRRRRVGDADGAQAALEEALSLSREHGRSAQIAVALAELACLPGGDAAAAVEALAACAALHHARRACWLLWNATGDRAHLAEAKRLLDDAMRKVPARYHTPMLEKVRLNREVAAACTEQGL